MTPAEFSHHPERLTHRPVWARQLNRLECLGWAVLAAEHLGVSTGEARMLARLVIERPGRAVSDDDLIDCLWAKRETVGTSAALRAASRVPRLRRALEDLGLPGAIVRVQGQGYLVFRETALTIRRRIEAVGE